MLIVVAETGSGKTTQLPQYLHEAGYTANGDEQEGVLHLKTTFFWHFYTQTPFTSAPQAPQHSDKLICHDLNPLSPFRNMHTIPYYPTVSAPVCPPILGDCINYCYFTMI